MRKKFYITTPIFYPSGKPHLGHAYTTVVADILARYKKKMGVDTYFVTGTDEHGQKIEIKAKENNIEPLEYVNRMAQVFVDLWKDLDISYDRFIRTTEQGHKTGVQEAIKKLVSLKKIYLDNWSSFYCTSCEENFTKIQLSEEFGFLKCKFGHEVRPVNEQTYFYDAVSNLQWLERFVEKNPDFIFPTHFLNELKLNFLNQLENLSISRTSFDWGIKLPHDHKHTLYVWIDALMNYVTALGYGQSDDKLLKKFWTEDTEIVQLVGKEIIRFHAIYWPMILKDLGLVQPKTILIHGWLTNRNQKMSKSLNNAFDPRDLIATFGSDAVRFFIAKKFYSDGGDFEFNEDVFVEIYNGQLANNFGNFANRCFGMIQKYFAGMIPVDLDLSNESDMKLHSSLEFHYANFFTLMDKYQIAQAYDGLNQVINDANKYIEELQPWNLLKEGKTTRVTNGISLLVKVLLNVAKLHEIVIPRALKSLTDAFSFDNDELAWTKKLSSIIASRKLNNLSPLFARYSPVKKPE